MKLKTTLGSAITVLALAAATQASAATYVLNLTANGDSMVLDLFSGARAELGRTWRGSDVLDGFFDNNDPSITYGSGVDIFPREEDFSNFATFDIADGVTNGTTAITGIAGMEDGWTASVVDDSRAATGIDINSRSFTFNSGSVTLNNGDVTDIDLDVSVALMFDVTNAQIGSAVYGGASQITIFGDFIVSGDSFSLTVNDTWANGVDHPNDFSQWLIDGQASATVVPLPGAALLLPSALIALVAAGRRRRTGSIAA